MPTSWPPLVFLLGEDHRGALWIIQQRTRTKPQSALAPDIRAVARKPSCGRRPAPTSPPSRPGATPTSCFW
eukprot:1227409-Pyramimonas_sp.AAC.1